MKDVIKLRPIDCCSEVQEPAPLSGTEEVRVLRAFKALSDKTRLGIFRLIAAQSEPICACDIVERFNVSQPTIAHHTRVLREAGLISVSRRGIWAYYQANTDAVSQVLGGFATTVLEPRVGVA